MSRAPQKNTQNQNASNQIAPEQTESPAPSPCSLCGHHARLVELPGLPDKYCSPCSADLATSILLKTEINAAWLSGQRYDSLAAELALLTEQLVARAQST